MERGSTYAGNTSRLTRKSTLRDIAGGETGKADV
jgi:hypothetical protein